MESSLSKKFVLDVSGVDDEAQIMASAFSGHLVTRVIFDSTKTISLGAMSFKNSSLTEFTLKSNVTYESNVCDGCVDLTTLNIESGVEEIPEYAFRGCDSLGNVTIPNTVTKIN